MAQWALQDAKNRFSTVVDAALAGEPQQVNRRGRPALVVLSVKEYERLCSQPPENSSTFIDHLVAIPRGDEESEIERIPLSPRSLKL